jgi:hypothetical protein
VAERAGLAAERAALQDARRAVRDDLGRVEALRAELAAHEQVDAEPVAAPQAVTPAGPAEQPAAPALDRVLAGLAGARLCFGQPIDTAGRTVVPVARVRGAGGFGRRGGGAPGGGGRFDARPVGVVEIGEDGTRFVRLPDPDARARAGATAAFAAALLAAAAATAFGALRRRRGAARLMSRR